MNSSGNASVRHKRKDFWERNRKSGGYLLRKQLRKRLASLCRGLLFFGLCFMILQPLLNKISVSFMPERDLYDTTVILLPRTFTLENYRLTAQLTNYGSALVNSFLVSLMVSVLQVAACTLVGYGFARFDFPLKKLWFACVIFVIIIPPQTISTSLFLSFRFFDIFGIFKALTGEPLNLRNSLVPYTLMSVTCMGLKNGLYIFMIRQYFRSVPASMEEAAYVDGCGTLQTFVKVLLPDSTPVLVSCFLFSFVWQWTDRFYTHNFISGTTLLSSELGYLAERLRRYVGGATNNAVIVSVAYVQQIISTAVLMAVVPLLILYIFAQKGFVESLSSTGIKM